MHSTVREIPAQLPEEVTVHIRSTAVDTFKALAYDGVARIVFMIDGANSNMYVNKINTTPCSLSSYLWEATGVNSLNSLSILS